MNFDPDYRLLNDVLIVGALLFVVGMLGCCVRRGAAFAWLSAGVMFQGIALSFAAGGVFHRAWSGQTVAFVFELLALAMCARGWWIATRSLPEDSQIAGAEAIEPEQADFGPERQHV